MPGDASDVAPDPVLQPEVRQLIGFVGAGQDEGLLVQLARIGDSFAEQRMAAAAIGPVQLSEQRLIGQLGAFALRRRNANINLVPQQRIYNV